MRRRLCDDLVRVRLLDDKPVHFRQGACGYEVTALLKMVAFSRLLDDVDLRRCTVRAVPEGIVSPPERVFELECDHGEWRLVAIWE